MDFTTRLLRKICFRPWNFMEIGDDLSVFNCCPSWTRGYRYGIIDGKMDVSNIWNSEPARAFRRSMLDGSFEFCDSTLCPMILNGSLPNRKAARLGIFGLKAKAILDNNLITAAGPTFVNLSCDRSCNLRCPSCRADFYVLNNHDSEQFQLKQELLQQVLKYAHDAKTAITLNVAGSGDPFASLLFMDFMTRIEGTRNPKIHLRLQTNGILFTPENWAKLHKMHANRITASISLDAGTEQTYALIRRGGNWTRLMKNLEFVGELYRKRQLNRVRLDFVVQQKNYREMPPFVDIARRHGFYCYFSRIREWEHSAYPGRIFLNQDVANPGHPEHREFLDLVNQDFGYWKIDFGNLSGFRTSQGVSLALKAYMSGVLERLGR